MLILGQKRQLGFFLSLLFFPAQEMELDGKETDAFATVRKGG